MHTLYPHFPEKRQINYELRDRFRNMTLYTEIHSFQNMILSLVCRANALSSVTNCFRYAM